MNWKPALVVGIVVAILGGLAGFAIERSGDAETTTTTTTETVGGTETTESTTDVPETETTTTETAPETTSTSLGTAEATVADVPVRAEITELARQGQFVTLSFTVTNLSRNDSDVFYRSFDDTTNGTAADGLLLIDPTNATEYRVVRNPDEGCLCSDEIPFTLEGEDTVSLFATFEAPPTDTSSVNVSFPGSLGTITSVPISG